MHIGFGKDFVEHSLARVLATWGMTIRDISFSQEGLSVLCYSGSEEGVAGKTVLTVPVSLKSGEPVHHAIDAIIRYHWSDGRLSCPECIYLISYPI